MVNAPLLALLVALAPALAQHEEPTEGAPVLEGTETSEGDQEPEALETQAPAEDPPTEPAAVEELAGDPPAEEPAAEEPPAEQPVEESPPEQPPAQVQDQPSSTPLLIDTSGAEDPGTLSTEQADWLKPRLGLLPPNPRAQTDFTAYVLEWGEIKIGLTNIQLGVLPGLQAGTSLPLWAFRIPNGNLKLDFVRAGPVDLAATGAYYSMPRDGFQATYATAGGMLSLKILEAWSIHGGASYGWVDSAGFPDLEGVSSFITGGQEITMPEELGDTLLEARLLQIKAATDIRFSRRDSLVLQFGRTHWARVITDPPPQDIPPIFNLDRILGLDGVVPFPESYNASLAWQIQWKHAQLRVGIGTSSTPGAWLLQSTEFSYRFLGATRVKEYRQRRSWRQNERAVEQGTLDGESPPAPAPEPEDESGD